MTGAAFTLDTLPDCPTKKGEDRFFVGTWSDLAERFAAVPKDNSTRRETTAGKSWSGNMSYNDALQKVSTGDLARVPDSDAFLARYENLNAPRGAWQTIDDVAGGVPNVQALLAGHPLTMRRRARVMKDTAPLTVAVDLVSSGGIDSDSLTRRGVAILALVRALSASRPVELWAGGSATPYNFKGACHVWGRIDTAPLDLARAAHIMTATAVARGLIYATLHDMGGDSSLMWPYCNHEWSRSNGRRILSRAFGSDDMLFIAAPHSNDEIIKDPEGWIERAIKTYGGLNDE